MEELISVIVPVYNVEKYLNECINSIVKQEYKNIEIILVDDGSTDTSGKMCDQLATTDERIRVIHKKNGGLSDARNHGISEAHGTYLAFIDSDDFVSQDFISSLYRNLVQNDADIAVCGFNRYFDEQNIINDQIQGIDKKLSPEEAIKYLNIYGYYSDSACNKLFQRSLFVDIEFPVGRLFEDTLVMVKIFDRTKAVYYNSNAKYFYRQRKGSIVTTPQNAKKQIDAATSVKEYIDKNHPELTPFVNQRIFGTYVYYYNSLLMNDGDTEERKRVRSELKRINKQMTYEGLKRVKKIQYGLLLYLPLIYGVIYKKAKK